MFIYENCSFTSLGVKADMCKVSLSGVIWFLSFYRGKETIEFQSHNTTKTSFPLLMEITADKGHLKME